MAQNIKQIKFIKSKHSPLKGRKLLLTELFQYVLSLALTQEHQISHIHDCND